MSFDPTSEECPTCKGDRFIQPECYPEPYTVGCPDCNPDGLDTTEQLSREEISMTGLVSK